MPLPGGATGWTLTGGPYDDPSFQGMAGKLTISTPVTHVATGERIRRTWDFSVDYSGNFSVGPLPFSDDPAFTPTGFTYTVTWQALSYKDTPGNLTFAVPMGSATAGVVDFDRLAPTATGVALPTTVFSVNGHTGLVTLAASDVGADPAGAAAAVLPAQAGQSGKFLTTNGSASSWAPAGSVVSDATTTTKGVVQLAGDLAGTAAAPTVAKINGSTPATVATTGAYADLTGKPTVPTVGAAGAGAGVALSSTDASVTNSRTPTTHAGSHAAGGSDPVTAASIGGTPILTPTAMKTAAYTAAVGDLAMMNAAGGASALTLPTAPADKSQVGYRAVGASASLPLTISRGGSTDTIGTTGATTVVVALTDEVAVLQYDAANTRWLAVSNVKTQASLDATYRSAPTPGPVSGAYQTVGTASNATDTGVNTMTKHVLPAGVGIETVRLRLANSAAASNGDVDTSNAITATASIGATTTGPWFPLRLRGSKSMVIDAGGDIETDPLWFHVAAGGTFYTKTFLSVTSGQTWWQQTPPGVQGTDYWSQQSTTETDLTLSTAAFTPTTGTRPWGPVAVLADLAPTQARVAMIGDSITGGLGDGGYSGYAWRALNGQVPWSRISVSGSRIKGIIDPNVGRRRMVLIRGANCALVMYGINDIATDSATLATLQGYHITLWSSLRNMGIKPMVCTILPNTASTDAWATTANQTVRTGETVRVAFNDWIRDGAPMLSGAAAATGSNAAGTLRAGSVGHTLAGYFETADTLESARNSGLWKVNGTANFNTTDGTHPTTAGHITLSAAIVPAKFTALAAA